MDKNQLFAPAAFAFFAVLFFITQAQGSDSTFSFYFGGKILAPYGAGSFDPQAQIPQVLSEDLTWIEPAKNSLLVDLLGEPTSLHTVFNLVAVSPMGRQLLVPFLQKYKEGKVRIVQTHDKSPTDEPISAGILFSEDLIILNVSLHYSSALLSDLLFEALVFAQSAPIRKTKAEGEKWLANAGPNRLSSDDLNKGSYILLTSGAYLHEQIFQKIYSIFIAQMNERMAFSNAVKWFEVTHTYREAMHFDPKFILSDLPKADQLISESLVPFFKGTFPEISCEAVLQKISREKKLGFQN
jgi:hypothetical protein